ncbi:class I SAM-dependent methyltransferase family protein [Candidatus Bathyarchaeota archaeon]|nr:class I SAM-dependent methyltransferase family protein [Candidatus Bathyarchaeota archaeon]
MKRETPLVEAYCIRVPKYLGERAIKAADKLDLLNKNLRVLRVGDWLFVPLTGEPEKEKLATLKREINQFEILIQEFPKREKTVKSIFDALEGKLPQHLLAALPHSIDFIGEVAILEIPRELEDYKRLVGEAILQTFKRVKSVLAKSGVTGGVYRLREYEVIAGSEDTETVHKEYGCKYYLDPRKVYFSPRLSYEHSRVASQVREGETIIDMFAGVGPFSILIAKTHRNVTVYAIDINPEAIKYLKRNIRANNVDGKVIPILGDAKEAVNKRLRGIADRVIMNLPEKAIEYVNAACSALKSSGGIIHYYEFARGTDAVKKVRNRIIEAVGKTGRNVVAVLSERIVKEVAPFKWQVAIDVKVQ